MEKNILITAHTFNLLSVNIGLRDCFCVSAHMSVYLCSMCTGVYVYVAVSSKCDRLKYYICKRKEKRISIDKRTNGHFGHSWHAYHPPQFSLHAFLPYFLIRLLHLLLLPPSPLTHPSLSIDITSHLTLLTLSDTHPVTIHRHRSGLVGTGRRSGHCGGHGMRGRGREAEEEARG